MIRRLAEGRTVRSVGVEEELLIVEPGTGRPRALAGAVMRAAGPGAEEPGAGERWAREPEAVQPLEFELQKQQLEIDTRPCRSLDELSRELRRCRATAAAAAARAGVTVAALGTSPLTVHPEVVHRRACRYLRACRRRRPREPRGWPLRGRCPAAT